MIAKILKFPAKPDDDQPPKLPEGLSPQQYILDGHTPVAEPDPFKWAMSLGLSKRRVCWTQIGTATISTVFFGLNHNWGEGPPLLFETMVFDGPLDKERRRCSTWEEAEQQHADMVEYVRLKKE